MAIPLENIKEVHDRLLNGWRFDEALEEKRFSGFLQIGVSFSDAGNELLQYNTGRENRIAKMLKSVPPSMQRDFSEVVKRVFGNIIKQQGKRTEPLGVDEVREGSKIAMHNLFSNSRPLTDRRVGYIVDNSNNDLIMVPHYLRGVSKYLSIGVPDSLVCQALDAQIDNEISEQEFITTLIEGKLKTPAKNFHPNGWKSFFFADTETPEFATRLMFFYDGVKGESKGLDTIEFYASDRLMEEAAAAILIAAMPKKTE